MLWNHYKVLFSLAFFSFFTFSSGSALAAAVAPWGWFYPSANFQGSPKQNASEACKAFNSTYSGAGNTEASSNFQHSANGIFQKGTYQVGALKAMCLTSSGGSSGYYVRYGQWCTGAYPSGTAPNMVCNTCPPGYVESGGSCVLPPQCPPAGSVTYPTALDGGFFVATQLTPPDIGPLGDSFCLPYNDGLCEVKCTTGVAGPNPIASGYAVACTSLTATGEVCPSAAPPVALTVENPLDVGAEGTGDEPSDPRECPPGTGFASINNISMCLPSGTSGTGTSSSSSSPGATTDSNSEWTIEADGTITTTRVTSVTIGGQTITGTTTTNSGVDGKDGQDGNDVDFGPAITWSAPAGDDLDPALAAGTPLPVFEPSTSLIGTGGGACPAPIAFDAMGQNFVIDFSPLCEWAGFFRAFLLIAASFAALRVLVMA